MISTLEKEITFRFLKARKKDGFLNIISIFSFIGISLGVAVLIIVMSVMNGFRTELINKIEVHTMKMESDGYGGKIMKMRKIKNPQIVANKPFILKPGADHLMFFGMGESIKKGKDIPLKFIFLDKQKLIEKTITFSVI